MNLIDYIVLGAVALAVIAALTYMLRQKKRGHCISCPHCTTPHCDTCSK